MKRVWCILFETTRKRVWCFVFETKKGKAFDVLFSKQKRNASGVSFLESILPGCGGSRCRVNPGRDWGRDMGF